MLCLFVVRRSMIVSLGNTFAKYLLPSVAVPVSYGKERFFCLRSAEVDEAAGLHPEGAVFPPSGLLPPFMCSRREESKERVGLRRVFT